MKSMAWTIVPFPCESTSAGRRGLRKDLQLALRVSGSSVIVDFSGCRSLNHKDIDLLLECLAQVAGRDTNVRLVAGSNVNRVLLEVTRISSLAPVFNSVEEALALPQATLQNHAESDAEDRSARQSGGTWRA
jgi:hypothetical protein